MPDTGVSPLVSCEWLAQRLDNPELVILDASFFLPAQARDAHAEFSDGHLPGARFFDIDQVADTTCSLPHMLPDAAGFASAVGALSVHNRSTVIVYDRNGFMASARAWWMFRVFGHQNVRVLDGGFRRWQALSLPMSRQSVRPETRIFQADFVPALLAELPQVREWCAQPECQILDARSSGRFSGRETEFRPGVRSGHIPDSLNLHYTQLLESQTGHLKSAQALGRLFESAGVNLAQPLLTSCGTGVTAAILALGLYCLGRTDVPVYDGSWTEWGSRDDTPIQTS